MKDGAGGCVTVAARYRYLGDRMTAPDLVGMRCDPVRVSRTWFEGGVPKVVQACVRGRNGNQLVMTADGRRYVVLGRRLRVIDTNR